MIKFVKNSLNKIKFALALVFGLALADASFAAATAYEDSVAKTIVDDASGTLTNFLTGAGTVVAGLVVAGLAVWGAIALVGILKRAFSTGKGR